MIGVEVKTNPQCILNTLREAVDALPYQAEKLIASQIDVLNTSYAEMAKQGLMPAVELKYSGIRANFWRDHYRLSGLQLKVAGVGAVGLVLGHLASGGAGALTLGRASLAEDRANLRLVSISSLKAAASKFRAFPIYSATEALANSAALLFPLLLIASALPGDEVGQLSLAVKVLSAPMVLLGAATAQVFLSTASAEHGGARLGEFVRETVGRMARFAVGPLVFLAVVAPYLFPVAFGHEWSRAGVLTAWLVPGVFLQLLSSPVSMSLHVIKAHRTALVLQIAGAVIRIGCVFLATLYLTDLASEVFALTALVSLSLAACASLAPYGAPRAPGGPLVSVSISRYYGLVGESSSLSDAMMMPPMTAARARTAMIQLVLPSSSL